MERYFLIFLFTIYFTMPTWLKLISQSSLKVMVKRVIMIVMVFISFAFYFIVVINKDPGLLTRIAGNVVFIAYLIIVFLTAYKNWPK